MLKEVCGRRAALGGRGDRFVGIELQLQRACCMKCAVAARPAFGYDSVPTEGRGDRALDFLPLCASWMKCAVAAHPLCITI